jgi:hypothetical protein
VSGCRAERGAPRPDPARAPAPRPRWRGGRRAERKASRSDARSERTPRRIPDAVQAQPAWSSAIRHPPFLLRPAALRRGDADVPIAPAHEPGLRRPDRPLWLRQRPSLRPDRHDVFLREIATEDLKRSVRRSSPGRPPARNSRRSTAPASSTWCASARSGRGLPRRRRYAGLARGVRGREPRRGRCAGGTEAMMEGRRGGPSCRSRACTMPRAATRRASACSTTAGSSSSAEAPLRPDPHRLRGHRRPPRRRRLLLFRGRPGVIFADIHEDGRFLYPGTGAAEEVGVGAARGTKLNLPLMPGSGDDEFWRPGRRSRNTSSAPAGVHHLPVRRRQPEGRPDHPPAFSEEAHAHAATRLADIADRHAERAHPRGRRRRLQPAQHRPRLDPRGAGLRRGRLSHRRRFGPVPTGPSAPPRVKCRVPAGPTEARAPCSVPT